MKFMRPKSEVTQGFTEKEWTEVRPSDKVLRVDPQCKRFHRKVIVAQRSLLPGIVQNTRGSRTPGSGKDGYYPSNWKQDPDRSQK